MIENIIIIIVVVYIIYLIYSIVTEIKKVLENLNRYLKLKNVIMECKIYNVSIENYDDVGNIRKKKFLD